MKIAFVVLPVAIYCNTKNSNLQTKHRNDRNQIEEPIIARWHITWVINLKSKFSDLAPMSTYKKTALPFGYNA